ncbi:MAG: hypothetical protein HN403_05830 [Rhodospirillales bacterium]|jgi:hypothetical protein|nr:hypothetical protein [Rhodospirillales bacterium]
MSTRLKSRFLAIFALPLLLGGCALPVGLQVASLVADGISFVATDKALTDHGISIVTKKDCAMWRGLKGDDICRTPHLNTLPIAAADEPIFFEPGPDGSNAMEDVTLKTAPGLPGGAKETGAFVP